MQHLPALAGAKRFRTALAAFCVCAALAPPPVAAKRKAPAPAEEVTLNFVNADIDSVVKAVSDITGRNFVLDPRVKGTVNIVSSRPMPKPLIYDVFLSALRLQGYAAVEERGVIKIVPEADAKLQSGPTFGPQEKPSHAGDQMQTRVFGPKYESAAQLVQVLRPLIAANNTITAYPNTNTLVITDYASNLTRIEKIIDAIDQPSGSEPIVIPLEHASALDVVQTVNRLYADSVQGGDGSQRISAAADTRSNSVLVRADNPSRLVRLRSLIAVLDSPTSTAGNIHVVYLKNAEAVKVAATLRAIVGEGSPESHPASGGTGSPSALSSSTSSPAGSSAPTSLAAGFIQADAATNSVIVTAPDAIYNNLRAVIDKLDVRRAQLYVEALIAEISADKAAEFGVQWQNIGAIDGTNNQARGFGGTNFGGVGKNILGVARTPGSVGTGLNVGVIRGTVTLPDGTKVLNLGLLARALESDSNANILSTPTLLTLDNEEARIVVGQNVPFITGQYALTGTSTTPTPFQTVERKDVGLTLKIKPQISEGGSIRLQIYQEASSVDNTTSNQAGLITNKRSIESAVLVDDGQIIVIGGLIQDSVNDGVEKVPLVGDIPLIGSFFQYKKRSHSKTNLMVFLRPTVLRDAEHAGTLSGERYDYIVREQKNSRATGSLLLPDVAPPTLPQRPPAAVP